MKAHDYKNDKSIPRPIFTLDGSTQKKPCTRRADYDNLTSMTRLSNPPTFPSKPRSSRTRPGYWSLQDAKSHFSELVRLVRSEGAQHVTVHGRDEVVVVAAEEFRRLEGSHTGQALIDAMQASPHRDTEIESRHSPTPMPVRDVIL